MYPQPDTNHWFDYNVPLNNYQSYWDQPTAATHAHPPAKTPRPEIPPTAEAAECIDALHHVGLGMVPSTAGFNPTYIIKYYATNR